MDEQQRSRLSAPLPGSSTPRSRARKTCFPHVARVRAARPGVSLSGNRGPTLFYAAAPSDRLRHCARSSSLGDKLLVEDVAQER